MNRRGTAPKLAPHITIRVSGQLFQGHLPYLEQLVHSAVECGLWPLLNLSHLEELEAGALVSDRRGKSRVRDRVLPEFHPGVDGARAPAGCGLRAGDLRQTAEAAVPT
jgi:hypothetical protein